MLILLVFRLVSSKHNIYNHLIYKNKQYKSCNLKLVSIVKCTECSRNLEFGKRTDQNFITQNVRHGKEYCTSKIKKLLKQCLKEVILAFAGWWSIFGNGRWWWIYFGWRRMVVGILWLVVRGGGDILAGGAWWWVVVDIFWMVVGHGGC